MPVAFEKSRPWRITTCAQNQTEANDSLRPLLAAQRPSASPSKWRNVVFLYTRRRRRESDRRLTLRRPCPSRSSYLRLLGHLQGIIDLNPQIPHRAFQLAVSYKQLNALEIFRAAVNQGYLGALQRMPTVGGLIEGTAYLTIERGRKNRCPPSNAPTLRKGGSKTQPSCQIC